MRYGALCTVVFSLIFAACGGKERPIPADPGQFEPDSPAVRVLSPEAESILALVNDPRVDAEELDHGAKLDRRAAYNIVEYRWGMDREPDTVDDRLYETIAELDDISYVGTRALLQLAEYARQHGYLATYEAPVDIVWPETSEMTYAREDVETVLREYRFRDAAALIVRATAHDDGDDRLDLEELMVAGSECQADLYAVEGYRFAERVVQRVMESFEIADRLRLLAVAVAQDHDDNGYLSRVEIERASAVIIRERTPK